MLSYSELLNPTNPRIEKLLRVGEAHFKKYGFRKTAIGDICADASISKPTFYKHFDKKETLFFAVMIYMERDFFSEYNRRVQRAETATDKLKAYLEVAENYFKNNPLLTQTFREYPELYKGWAANPLNVENYLASVDFVEEIIREGISAGEFRVADVRRAAHVIVLSTTLFVIFEPQIPGVTVTNDAAFLNDLLLNGIRKSRE